MKTVYLLRHGKSDWDADYQRDAERPLARRGQKAADRMGAFFAVTEEKLDYVISSPAERARRTAERFLEAGTLQAARSIDERLYEGDEDDVLDVIGEQSDGVESILLVGHEPTWSTSASMLIGGGDLRFPTAALARIDLHIDEWTDADEDTGELVWFVTPRMLQPLMKRLKRP